LKYHVAKFRRGEDQPILMVDYSREEYGFPAVIDVISDKSFNLAEITLK
jgi:hypothetical protein